MRHSPTDCGAFAERLARALEQGDSALADFSTAASGCPKCVEMLRLLVAATEPEHISLPQGQPPSSFATSPLPSRLARRLWVWLNAVRVALSVGLAAAWLALPWLGLVKPLGVPTTGDTLHRLPGILVAAVLGSWLWYLGLVRRERGHRPQRLHARWKRGRLLQGVCVGIGEYFGISPWWVRAAFVALALLGLGGLPLYLLLVLGLSFHPDDRQYLLRFKVERLWRRWTGAH